MTPTHSLYCPKCQRNTQHTVESGVNEWGQVWQHDRCGVCRATSVPGSGAHEIPNVAPVPPLDDETLLASVGLTGRRKHLEYARWLYQRGIVGDRDNPEVSEVFRMMAHSMRAEKLPNGATVYVHTFTPKRGQ